MSANNNKEFPWKEIQSTNRPTPKEVLNKLSWDHQTSITNRPKRDFCHNNTRYFGKVMFYCAVNPWFLKCRIKDNIDKDNTGIL